MNSGVFSFCKGIDTFCPLGPHIVTADEIPNPNNLAMELRVNGKARQQSHSSKMSVKIPEILAHYSPMGYSAGDVLSTGTVSGVAAFSGDPKAWYLKPGDVMECEIERIGVLRNPVISWKEAYGGKPVPVLDAGRKAEVWGFARATRADVEELVRLGAQASVIEVPTSDIKLKAYGISREQAVARATEAIRFAKQNNITVAFFAVDGTRTE